MAKPDMVLTGAGIVAQPGRISRDEDGTISDATMSKVFSGLRNLVDKFNNGISLGDGTNLSRAGNLDAQLVEFTMPGSANQELAIDHSLERTPVGYIPVLQSAKGVLYTSNFGGWSTQTFYLKSDQANGLWLVILF